MTHLATVRVLQIGQACPTEQRLPRQSQGLGDRIAHLFGDPEVPQALGTCLLLELLLQRVDGPPDVRLGVLVEHGFDRIDVLRKEGL